ncbi:hypothetical protein [Massilia eburnea]|uniref:hypothetical protein n=1 Tax=Massilia eburnea TaxID=1776165 RepID=UPI0014793EFD|nr:hypothetical protein [Massilia eburnea]
MKSTQLTRGRGKRLMYIENKDGLLAGQPAWIGWATFSKTGRTVYYKRRSLRSIAGGCIRGNFMDCETGEEYWVSGVKTRGSNVHRAALGIAPVVDDDAKLEYERITSR